MGRDALPGNELQFDGLGLGSLLFCISLAVSTQCLERLGARLESTSVKICFSKLAEAG